MKDDQNDLYGDGSTTSDVVRSRCPTSHDDDRGHLEEIRG